MAKLTKATVKTTAKAPAKASAKVVIIPKKAVAKAPVKAAKSATKSAPIKVEEKVAHVPQSLDNIERISVPSGDGKFMVIETGVGSKKGYRKEYITDIDPVDHGEGQE